MIEFKNVSAFQHQTQVLDNFSLTIGAGERVAILGPNGAGKSTLLKLIAREIYPVEGEGSYFKLFESEKITLWELRERIGFMSQEFQEDYTPFTQALDVVVSGFFGSIGCHDRFIPSPEQYAHARAMLEVIGMPDCQYLMFQRLSAGQQRRLILARAFIHHPELLIFDEPTNHLDVGASKTVLNLMRDFCHATRGVILTTHDVHEIIPEIDRVILLQQGRILIDGPKDEVLTAHALSELYQVDLQVDKDRGWYHLRYA
ncbi:ATP-binding cassette domain-containing protein [Pseudomonas sp. PB120]|uniref:ABC transporter ATP-binding protein n=1 Tax=Pseudomonas sp. PB120 TaxID=2494700 RepID=UPI0012FDC4F7|nr:ATP-binding cassette domain-containing protein [Pseudomonas sp. PB120]MVV51781.1 ATP-binding cassette domain-containing protein [Pseudomonas sp. PB120]